MATAASATPRLAAAAPSLERRVWQVYRGELHKLSALALVRLLLVLVIVGPFAFAALLHAQSSTPSDAIFGVDVHDSGFAVSLVVLSFAGNWGVPIIAGLVAGDMFAGEDRHNTWKTILTRSCSLGDIFAGKVLAAITAVLALVAFAAAASLIAGIAFSGFHPLVDLSGSFISAGHALGLTVLAWALCALPALSFTGLGVLFSIASRNGVVGVIGPLVAALATLLLDLVGRGVWVHLVLPGATFTNLFGLFTAPAFLGPLVVTLVASAVWTIGSLAGGWALLRRRDFIIGVTTTRFSGWRAPLQLACGVAVVVAVLAILTNVGPTGVTRVRVQRSVAVTFSNASLLQQRLIGRGSPAGARLDVEPYCSRGSGIASRGPGDWLCDVYVYLPQPKSVPFQRTNVEYDLSVASDGCYKAESPPSFVGNPTMARASGGSVANPLYVVYGCFNPLR